MIRTQVQQSTLTDSVDLTPLIDIIFIVLVFLLLTANAQILTLPVAVPEQQETELSTVQDPKVIAVSIVAQTPHYALDQQQFDDWDAFKAAFLSSYNTNPEHPVIVAADKEAPIQPLMKLLALLQAKQITQTHIIMEESK
ncbi:ExbD/TolR family protein [Ferrimonas lipolytica]|uniref:Biopolymer transporter ExbD n=1 Tax=Ferrimonas lipolytica TaxID=2724191 RepID=A0A6H1UAW5_9GAMM|nr:biopolymer transporter ExbD [Ferrimonas lipolytica]QIZ76217.1 biopolymer transporter ExbD [Ferrimonas lipolytica]